MFSSFVLPPTGSRGKFAVLTLLLVVMAVSVTCPVWAQTPAPKVDTGDTAWMLLSAALVMLMTPGLALFYGGMVRAKNILNVMMQSYVALGVVTLVWVLWGYSLAFSPGGKVLGSLAWFGLQGVGQAPNGDYAATIPHQVFMIYQMMFAVITPALISGAIAERMKFSTYLVFMLLWSTLVYCPLAHWVWGKGGWLGAEGVGGTFGAIATGLFASVAVNASGANGLFYGGGFALLGKQCLAAGCAIAYAAFVTFILLATLRVTMGLRVTVDEEEAGLDLTQHGEPAYADME